MNNFERRIARLEQLLLPKNQDGDRINIIVPAIGNPEEWIISVIGHKGGRPVDFIGFDEYQAWAVKNGIPRDEIDGVAVRTLPDDDLIQLAAVAKAKPMNGNFVTVGLAQ